MYLNFQRSGSGNTVVLLHGYCEDNTVWNGFVEELCKHYDVVNVDLPGFGLSESLTKGFSLDEVAIHIVNTLKSAGINKYVCIGHSLGGYVALSMYKYAPEVVKTFGLFHSTAFADSDEKKELRNKAMAFLQEHSIEKFASSFVKPLFYEENLLKCQDAIHQMTSVAKLCNRESLVEYTRAMRDREDNSSLLTDSNSLPVLIIAGKQDNSVPYENSLRQINMMKEKKHVHILDNCAHMGMFERERVTLEAVLNFLALL